ncbi:MAG: hypothetical protein IAF08_02320 [Rhizobacter sp.]|nr:hypothetical protein [Chlorobiales bacterium]
MTINSRAAQTLSTGLFAAVLLAGQFFTGCSGCKKPDEVSSLKPDTAAVVKEKSLAEKYAESLAREEAAAPKVKKTYSGGGATEAPTTGGTTTETKLTGIDYDNMEDVADALEGNLKASLDAAWRRTGAKGNVAFKLVVAPSGSVKQFILLNNDLDAAALATVKSQSMRVKYKPHPDAAGDIETSMFKFLSP